MIYLRLFLSFCYIGVLSFGGGYAMLPLISQQCIEQNLWLTMAEFSDLITISQITPGPIAINAATFVGMKVAGVLGSFVATLGLLVPPFIIVSILYSIFKRYGKLTLMQNIMSGLKPCVVALIAVAAVDICVEALWSQGVVALSTLDIFAAVLALVAFIVLRKWKPGVIVTILTCGAIGIIRELLAAFVFK